MLGYVKNELTRLLLKKRWLIFLPAALIPAHFFGVGTVNFFQQNKLISGQLNIWDAFFFTFCTGNDWTIGIFFLPVYAFISGDCFSADLESGYLSWLLVRNSDKRELIWMSKVIAISIGAFIFSAVYSTTILVYSMFFLPKAATWGAGIREVALKSAEFNVGVSVYSSRFFSAISPIKAFLFHILFIGLALSALISALLFFSLIFKKGLLPLIVSLILGFSSGAVFQYLGMKGLNPTTRMNFFFHTGVANIEPKMMYSHSIIVWSILLCLSLCLGNRIFLRGLPRIS